MGSKTSSVTSNSSTVSAAPSWFSPYQQFGAQEASRLYGQSGRSPLTSQAGDYLSQVLGGGGGQQIAHESGRIQGREVPTQINQNLTDTAAGKFLNSNQYLDQMFSSASRPVVDQIQAQFSKAGRVGSAANQDVLGRTLSEMSGNIYGQNYAQERANQLQASNAITGYGARDNDRYLQNAIALNQVYNNDANRRMQALLFAPQFAAEQSGQGDLTRYLQQLGLVNPGTNQSTTQSQPITSNPFGEAVGVGSNALIAASLANQSGLFKDFGNLFGSGGGASFFGGAP
jgi:hypothetical protein